MSAPVNAFTEAMKKAFADKLGTTKSSTSIAPARPNNTGYNSNNSTTTFYSVISEKESVPSPSSSVVAESVPPSSSSASSATTVPNTFAEMVAKRLAAARLGALPTGSKVPLPVVSSTSVSEAVPIIKLSKIQIVLQEFMFDMLRILTFKIEALPVSYKFLFLLKGGNAVKLLHNIHKYGNEFPVTNHGVMEPLGDMDTAILIDPTITPGTFKQLHLELFKSIESILLEQLGAISPADVMIDMDYYSKNLSSIVLDTNRKYISPVNNTPLIIPQMCPFILSGKYNLNFFNSESGTMRSSETSLFKLYLNTKDEPIELMDIAIPYQSELLRFEYPNYNNNINYYPIPSTLHMKPFIQNFIPIGSPKAIYHELEYILAKGLNTRKEKIDKRTGYMRILESLIAINSSKGGRRRNTRSKKRRSTKKRRSRI
jgi:hypothetical protein